MASRLNMYLTYETLFENETNNSMMEIVNIYYESDFIATVKLPEDIADKDFYLDFYTSGTRPVARSEMSCLLHMGAIAYLWAHSSIGRALVLQTRGREFDSRWVQMVISQASTWRPLGNANCDSRD